VHPFESALAAFVRAEIPFRATRRRLSLAMALRHSDAAVAAAEARTALITFEDLGAGHEADAAAALLETSA